MIDEDRYESLLSCLYGTDFKIPKFSQAGIKTKTESVRLDQRSKDTLRRQMRDISKAYLAAQEASALNPKTVVNVPKSVFFEELDDAVASSRSSGHCYRKAGSSHVVAVIQLNQSSFSDRILKRAAEIDMDSRIGPVEDYLRSIVVSEASDNSLIMSNIGFSSNGLPVVARGMTPLLWWPIRRDSVSDILFGRITAISFYNPAIFGEGCVKKDLASLWMGGGKLFRPLYQPRERRSD